MSIQMVSDDQASSIIDLKMPPDFPSIPFDKVWKATQPHAHNPKYSQFIAAWKAVGYRFVSMAEYDESFTSSIRKHGPGPAGRARYEQERDLFGFSSSAYSASTPFTMECS
jgi:hypothetical protein